MAAEEGRVDEVRGVVAVGSDLRHEGVLGAARCRIGWGWAEGRLDDIPRRWEVGRGGGTCHVGVARAVDGDGVPKAVTGSAPEVGGVEEEGAGGIEHTHEDVVVHPAGTVIPLDAVRRRWEVGGLGVPCYVGVAPAVHGDATA